MGDIVSARHDLRTQPLSARERLIVALDVQTVREAHRIVDELEDTVSFYKIGLLLQLDQDLRSLFDRLTRDGKRIFLDFKYIDIPATIEGAVRAASRLGFKFITVIGQSHIVKAAVKGRGNSDLKILAVTLLTGMTEGDMQKEYCTKLSLEEFVEKRAREAYLMGCDGVISSPNEVKLIRSAIQRDNFLVVTPGIRQIGAEPDDQKRTATPRDAILNGADHLVVGRPITRQRDKREAAQRIIDQVAAAIEYQEDLGRSAPLQVTAAID
jgi:orotidine-5'-phosphate decarboxylase